ncbi:alpha/beta hydrolase family protein [Fusibacter sp. JL298sf-3]
MKPLELDTFYDFTYLSGLNFNESGSYALFHKHVADVKENAYKSDAVLLSFKNGAPETQTLTHSGKVGKAHWLKDDRTLIYAMAGTDAEKKQQQAGAPETFFYAISAEGGESYPYMTVPAKVVDVKALGDDAFLMLVSYRPLYDAYTEADEAERQKVLESWKEEEDYEVIEEIPFWSNGGTYTRGARTRLCHFNKATGTLRYLTDANTAVSQYDYNEDTGTVLAVGRTYTEKMPIKSRLFMGSLTDDCLKPITDETYAIYCGFAMTSETVVFVGHDGQKHGLNQNAIFYTLNVKSGVIEPLLDIEEMTFGNTVGADVRYGGKRSVKRSGEWLYFISTERYHAYLNRLHVNGQFERVVEKAGTVDDFDLSGDQLLITAMRGNALAEIFQVNAGEEKACTSYNTWLSAYSLSTPEHMTVATAEDVTVDGWVMKPIGYEKGKRYPAILDIHGGPKTVYSDVFYNEMQYWANQGYFVFFANPRGSDGKGNGFSDIRGQYGSIDYSDLMAFTDQVLEDHPEIDEAQLFVTGGSYGGFMTNWIIGHTDRFKAAASQRSIANWLTEYGVTDIGYYFVPDQTQATPWKNFEALWAQSPLKYADRVKTPTLFIHSDQDYRCWIPEAYQMFTALKDHGVPSKLCVFKGENHELSRSGKPKHRLRRIREITEWFDQYRG